MTDFAYWKCPTCGAVVSGETVVDKDWPAKVEAHKETHRA